MINIKSSIVPKPYYCVYYYSDAYQDYPLYMLNISTSVFNLLVKSFPNYFSFEVEEEGNLYAKYKR